MDLVGSVQLVAGNVQSVPFILDLLKKSGTETQGNPDIYIREYASFGVEEARELAARATSRAIASDRRIFIIVTPGMTNEAQNALLKTLEEPSASALFFIVVPSPQTLLPTLRSRAQILPLRSATPDYTVDPTIFVQANQQKRLDMLKPLLDKGEDDTRDLDGAIAFLSALEKKLSEDPEKNTEGLEAVYRARKYLGDKGSLMKALMEQVALLI